jgi:hypothetical protein
VRERERERERGEVLWVFLLCLADRKTLSESCKGFSRPRKRGKVQKMGSESKNEGIEGVSPTIKKVVQSLKEIVKHCTEQEIYVMLKECNMDPNEAAQLLLSQGLLSLG